ncbi:uncharacterized protein LOC126818851 [Patella vulgata]|uniref:uncharacterized protein LOC126818851 n=1 Tax=Patella vulgata TaxID=6465 RepID=UPI0024A8C885|nr:uncharacterized protein LOC126818851 [Patella vulgata]
MQNIRATKTTVGPEGVSVTNELNRENTILISPVCGETKLSSVELVTFILAHDNFDIKYIKCLQNIGNGNFYLTVDSQQSKDIFVGLFESFTINDLEYESKGTIKAIWEYPVDSIPIVIYNLFYEIDNKDIARKISNYADVIRCERPCYKNFPTIESGVRIIHVKRVFKPIPSHIFIKGLRVGVKYEGQIRYNKTCFNCGEQGHLGRDCPLPDKRTNKSNFSPIPEDFPPLQSSPSTELPITPDPYRNIDELPITPKMDLNLKYSPQENSTTENDETELKQTHSDTFDPNNDVNKDDHKIIDTLMDFNINKNDVAVKEAQETECTSADYVKIQDSKNTKKRNISNNEDVTDKKLRMKSPIVEVFNRLTRKN